MDEILDRLRPPAELVIGNNVGLHTSPDRVMEEYDRIGRYLFMVLKNRAGVAPASDILDMGCGTGRVAAQFAGYLTTGTYTGVDVVSSSIDWCTDAYSHLPNFRFLHADLYSEFYNPEGSASAATYRFPSPDASLDVVWSASLFTHMLIDGVDNYLKEMARVLRPGGRIWNSYLLLDEASEPQVLGPRTDGRRMMHEVDGGRIAYKDKPEWVVGLHKDRILELHERHGFDIKELLLSNWSGGRPDADFRGQDVIMAVKR